MSDIMPAGHNPRPDWSDEDWAIFDTWLRSILHSNIVQLTFTKVDGTERTMNCTLMPDMLPQVVVSEDKKERKVSTTSIAVCDVELKEWRSFRTTHVKQIRFDFVGRTYPFPTGPKP